MPPISLGLLGEGGVRGGRGESGLGTTAEPQKPPTPFSRVTSTRCKEERVNYRLMHRLPPGVHHPRSQSRATPTFFSAPPHTPTLTSSRFETQFVRARLSQAMKPWGGLHLRAIAISASFSK